MTYSIEGNTKTSTYEQLAKEICGNSMQGRSLIDGSLPESRNIYSTDCDFNDVGVLCIFSMDEGREG